MVLNLTYPEPQEGQEFLTETEPSVLNKLIENDGSANINTDIKRITQLLHDINRCSTSLSKSEEILKLFHAKYSSFCQALRDYSSDSVNDEASTDILMHSLTKEMSFAYKAYLELLDGQANWVFGLNKKTALAVTYCLHYLSLLKAEFYCFGRALPSYLWQEIYHLYQYAENHKLTTTKVKDPTNNKISVSINPKCAFARASLMASMEPYHLKREEIWNLFHKVNGYADNVEISSDPEMLKDFHCFHFNYAHSDRPRLLRKQHKHNSDSRYINVDTFAGSIKDELKNLSASRPQKYPFLSENDSFLHEKLLQIMYKYSVQYVPRASDRYPVDIEAKVLYGFQDILHLLRSNIDLTVFPEPEVFEKVANDASSEQSLVWQMINESLGGACIAQEQDSEISIQDATPVILSKKLPDADGAWKLAISCWNKLKDSERQIGLKYIKGQLSLAKEVNNPDQELILIGPDEKGSLFLLTPKHALKSAKNFVISANNRKLLVCKKSTSSLNDSDLTKIQLVKKSG